MKSNLIEGKIANFLFMHPLVGILIHFGQAPLVCIEIRKYVFIQIPNQK